MFVCPFTVCTHSFWRIFGHSFLFFTFSPPSLHKNTSLKWLTPSFLICIHDVIIVEQKCYACLQTWYTSILLNGTMPQAGIDPPGQSHASYEASALPPNHHGWICWITCLWVNPVLGAAMQSKELVFIWLRLGFSPLNFNNVHFEEDLVVT